jgi:hypothetical protein
MTARHRGNMPGWNAVMTAAISWTPAPMAASSHYPVARKSWFIAMKSISKNRV